MKKIALLASTVAMLTACSTPAPLLKMPTKPADERKSVITELNFVGKPLTEDDYVELQGHKINMGSTVVINVPSGLFEDKSKAEAGSQDFNTAAFFNEAEQQIEKVLIRKGFRLLSRSKFEAKLRDLRDETRCETISCLRSKVAPEVRPILDKLEADYKRGVISTSQYMSEVGAIKAQAQTASMGRNRNDDQKELTDISEVIRAAQSGDTQADYILQINRFETEKTLRATKRLIEVEKVRAFIGQYPDIESQFNSPGRDSISCAINGAELNAKLIHVKSGAIVWIGSHTLNELNSGAATKIAVEYSRIKKVNNEYQIQRFVDFNNTEEQRALRADRRTVVPPWQYSVNLVGPTVIQGHCKDRPENKESVRQKLAREVAKQLIKTISVGI